MAMQTVYFKERDGIVGNNPIGQLLSAPQTTWWNVFGSQPLSTEILRGAETVRGSSELDRRSKHDSATQFTLSAGDGKNSEDVLKPQGGFTKQSACFEFGFTQAQPTICPKYPYVEQYYGVVSAYGSQIPGRIMLPVNVATEDGPIYVNAKQYHGIMRRRQSRAKAVLENKATKCRKQPYMHYSRHLHAMRRPRGSGGRFLNTKALDNEKSGAAGRKGGEAKQPQPSNSQNSEVFHPDNGGTMNSSREANGSNVSGSEVTSMMDCFLGSSISIHSLSGIVMPGCCNLNV